MNYRVRREGVELGTFPLEELRRRRESGELSGREYVQAQGRKDWQPLDLFLQYGDRIIASKNPVAPPQSSPVILWTVLLVAVVVFAVFVGLVVYGMVKGVRNLQAQKGGRIKSQVFSATKSDAVRVASLPVHWTTNTLTQKEVNRQARAFRQRQWLDAYQEHGRHDAPWDAEAKQMLSVWLDRNFGTNAMTNLPSTAKLCDELTGKLACDDPLVLTVAALNSEELFEKSRRLERAVKAFEQSKYRAYPRFCAKMEMAQALSDVDQIRGKAMDSSALTSFAEAFKDGSFTPQDQTEIANLLILGFGSKFRKRNGKAIYTVVQTAGSNFQWLELVLEGEYDINEAWNARGDGYANTVTDKGWEDFQKFLARARQANTLAWELRPNIPLAAGCMMRVSLGDSDITEMRTWFDRAVSAQIDFEPAWSEFRWGLRPRWFGDEDAMLALGVTALNTGRFDTDVPRKLYDSIKDVESEEDLGPGQHIFDREDIWPNLQKMYEGYIAEPSAAPNRDGWRSAYAVVAYFAGKYDVSARQFQASSWEPEQYHLNDRGTETSLLPLEVAARTGPAKIKIERAETLRDRGENSASLKLYHELEKDTTADTRTREFIRARIASLEIEHRLESGNWVDFLPGDDHDDRNWVFASGKAHVLPDGALEVESDSLGHYLYSRTRVGPDFEVKGEFEVVRSSTKSFQAGLIMGTMDAGGHEWNSFRMKRNDFEGQVASYSHGWGLNGVQNRLTLAGTTNSFDFTCEDNRATATVNGKQVLTTAKLSRDLNADSFMVGIGAFNDVNTTVIRYRHLQIRKLTSTSSSTKRR